MHEIKGKGITKIVDSHQVELMTREGYELIGMYQENSDNPCYDQVPDPNGGFQGATISITKYLPSTNSYFIMRLDEESSMVEMHSKLEYQQKQIDDTVKTLDERRDKITALTKSLELSETRAESVIKDYEAKNKVYLNTLTIKDNMESDIAKIREAIGSQRMREILEEK